jgi:hypothetical protein
MSRKLPRSLSRPLLVALLACVVTTGTASANHNDPQKKLMKADNTRARAMLVKRTDLPVGFQVRSVDGDDPHLDCPAAVGESDLTRTGEAHGQVFASGASFVESGSQVYETLADAEASWRRSTSTAGVKCVTTMLRREYATQGIRLMSFRKIAFPRVAQRSIVYRAEVAAASAQGTVTVYMDLVGLMHSRAHATMVVGSAYTSPSKVEELRLARLIAKRMATAMRGS